VRRLATVLLVALRYAYPGLLDESLRGTDRKTPETRGRAAEQPDAGDATAVSTVRGGCTDSGSDGSQEVAEWAPLIFVRYAA
jgi:hypothetical protein